MNSKVGRALGTAVRSGPMFSGCPSLMWKAAVLKAPFLTVVPHSEGPNIKMIPFLFKLTFAVDICWL